MSTEMMKIGNLAGGAIDASNILDLGLSQRILYPRNEGYRPNTYVPDEARGVIDMGEQEPYGRKGYQSMNTQYEDLNAQANLNSDMQGGMGGDMRAPRKLDMTPGEWQLEGSEAPNANNGNEAEKTDAMNAVETKAATAKTIDDLLAVLAMLANMGPQNSIFRLDEMYKNSDPMKGIHGTPAGYPQLGQETLETQYNLGM